MPRLTAALDVGSVFLRLSQSAVNTLSSAIAVWTPALSPPIAQPQEAGISAHFIVCNDTNRRLRFGQADTDEEIALEKRKAITYSWRSQQIKKMRLQRSQQVKKTKLQRRQQVKKVWLQRSQALAAEEPAG